MRKTILRICWGIGFILCACLGFIQQRSSALQGLLTALSVLFFLPPALSLFFAAREKDKGEAKLVRNLSGLSLGLTALALSLSIATAAGSEALVRLFNVLLTVVSAPMYCSGSWALSLFLWACLLLTGIKLSK